MLQNKIYGLERDPGCFWNIGGIGNGKSGYPAQGILGRVSRSPLKSNQTHVAQSHALADVEDHGTEGDGSLGHEHDDH